MAERPAAKPVAQPDSEWETVQPDEWQTVTQPAAPSFRGELDKAATPEPIKWSSGVSGMAKSALNDLGAGIVGMASPIWHPEAFAQSMQPRNAWEHLGGPAAIAIDRMAAPLMKHEGEKWSDYGGRIAGQGISMIPQFAAAKAMPAAPDSMTAFLPTIVPEAETRAERLMQAISPPEGLTPGNVRAAMREAPQVREYAQRTGNPLRTIPEGTKAAEGVAQEGLNHYKAHFLDPNADVRVHLPNNISPELGAGATLRQIDQRISDINDLIRGSERTAKSTGQEMTASEKLGLANEAKALRGKLYEGLSERTGVAPEEIQNLREGYGGQFAIKNALESGHYQRLTNTGRMSQGTGNVVPLTRTGAVDRLITTLRGGPERIADRQFRRRIAAFEPHAPAYPFPRQIPAAPFEPETQILPPRPNYPRMQEAPFGAPPIPEPTSLNGPMRKAAPVMEDEHTARLIEAERNNAYRSAQREAREGAQRKGLANEMTKGKRLDILAAKKGLK